MNTKIHTKEEGDYNKNIQKITFYNTGMDLFKK